MMGVANFVWRKIRRRHDLIERKHADEISNAKLQFFINISHEIRTPMTLIMGPLEKLMKTDCNSDTAKNYQLIYRNAHRILNLVNQLMDIHKVDRGQMSVHFEETELVSFIEEVMQSFEYTAHKRQIHFFFITQWINKKHG